MGAWGPVPGCQSIGWRERVENRGGKTRGSAWPGNINKEIRGRRSGSVGNAKRERSDFATMGKQRPASFFPGFQPAVKASCPFWHDKQTRAARLKRHDAPPTTAMFPRRPAARERGRISLGCSGGAQSALGRVVHDPFPPKAVIGPTFTSAWPVRASCRYAFGVRRFIAAFPFDGKYDEFCSKNSPVMSHAPDRHGRKAAMNRRTPEFAKDPPGVNGHGQSLRRLPHRATATAKWPENLR